jgi:Fe-S-cluster containining protein
MEEVLNMLDQICAANPRYSRLEIMNYLKDGMKFYSSQAKELRKGNFYKRVSVVASFYKKVDEDLKRIDEEMLQLVTCKKGCAHCCKMMVVISKAEAEYLYHYCKENQIKIDENYLVEQTKLDDKDAYIFSPYGRCVFLKSDNTCGVYPVRPIPCRKYMVVSDPLFCNIGLFPGKQVPTVATLDADMMSAGLMGASEAYGSLPQMLSIVIKERKNKKK